MRRLRQARKELLDEARLAKSWFSDDHDELAFACSRSIPAARKHVQFPIAADERRHGPRAASWSGAAAANDAKEENRLGRTPEIARTQFLGNKETSYLALDVHGDEH
jgi:hypothetical protein